MQSLQTPAPEHQEFDAICSRVDEFETLPNVQTTPTEEPYAHENEEAAPVNELILAGLVTPY